jgi:hypothetical protein
MPYTIIRWAVSSTGTAEGSDWATIPSSTKSTEQASANSRFVITPAADTIRSPRT